VAIARPLGLGKIIRLVAAIRGVLREAATCASNRTGAGIRHRDVAERFISQPYAGILKWDSSSIRGQTAGIAQYSMKGFERLT